MDTTAKFLISEAKNYQRYGNYDLAIDELTNALLATDFKDYEIDIRKLLCFNYRKIGNRDMALLHINHAINSLEANSAFLHSKEGQLELAICLMNKGIVFEEAKSTGKAISCYLQALEIFERICDNEDNVGLIINALFTIGMLYYEQHDNKKTRFYFAKAEAYFDKRDTPKEDRRYLAIKSILSELDN